MTQTTNDDLEVQAHQEQAKAYIDNLFLDFEKEMQYQQKLADQQIEVAEELDPQIDNKKEAIHKEASEEYI